MKLLFVTVATATVMALVACSDDSTGEPAASPNGLPDESNLARAMMLTLADFPTGWAETPQGPGTGTPFSRCVPAGIPAHRSALVESGYFTPGSASSVAENVVIENVEIYDSSDFLESLQSSSSTFADCFVQIINEGKLNSSDASFSNAKASVVAFPNLGDHTDAYRLEFRAQARGQTVLRNEVTVYVEDVQVYVGRVALNVSAQKYFSPFDSTLLESVVRKAVAKVTPPPPLAH